MTMLMPRELGLGQRRRSDNETDWFLTMAPPPEVASLRGVEQRGVVPVQFRSTGSQLEVRVRCAATIDKLEVDVLRSASGAERLTVSYYRSNHTLSVDQRHANAEISRSAAAAALVQMAPYDVHSGPLELRVFVDGGLVQTFLNDEVTVTTLVNLSAMVSPPDARGVAVNSSAKGNGESECSASVWPLSL